MANIPQNTNYGTTGGIPSNSNISNIIASLGKQLKDIEQKRNVAPVPKYGDYPNEVAPEIKSNPALYPQYAGQSTPLLADSGVALGTPLSKDPTKVSDFKDWMGPMTLNAPAGVQPSPETSIRNFPSMPPLGTTVSEPTTKGQYIYDPNNPSADIRAVPRFDDKDNPSITGTEAWKRRMLLRNGLNGRLYQVDHIVPIALDGGDTLANYEVLSNAEHDKKSRIQQVAMVLRNKGVISKQQAQLMAQNWRDHTSDEDLVQQDRVDLDYAKRKMEEWSGVPKTGWKDILRGVPEAAQDLGDMAEEVFGGSELAGDVVAGLTAGVGQFGLGLANIGSKVANWATLGKVGSKDLAGELATPRSEPGMESSTQSAKARKRDDSFTFKLAEEVGNAAATAVLLGGFGKALGAMSGFGTVGAEATGAAKLLQKYPKLAKYTSMTMGAPMAFKEGKTGFGLGKFLMTNPTFQLPIFNSQTAMAMAREAGIFAGYNQLLVNNKDLGDRARQFGFDFLTGAANPAFNHKIKGYAGMVVTGMVMNKLGGGTNEEALRSGLTMGFLHSMGHSAAKKSLEARRSAEMLRQGEIYLSPVAEGTDLPYFLEQVRKGPKAQIPESDMFMAKLQKDIEANIEAQGRSAVKTDEKGRPLLDQPVMTTDDIKASKQQAIMILNALYTDTLPVEVRAEKDIADARSMIDHILTRDPNASFLEPQHLQDASDYFGNEMFVPSNDTNTDQGIKTFARKMMVDGGPVIDPDTGKEVTKDFDIPVGFSHVVRTSSGGEPVSDKIAELAKTGKISNKVYGVKVSGTSDIQVFMPYEETIKNADGTEKINPETQLPETVRKNLYIGVLPNAEGAQKTAATKVTTQNGEQVITNEQFRDMMDTAKWKVMLLDHAFDPTTGTNFGRVHFNPEVAGKTDLAHASDKPLGNRVSAFEAYQAQKAVDMLIAEKQRNKEAMAGKDAEEAIKNSPAFTSSGLGDTLGDRAKLFKAAFEAPDAATGATTINSILAKPGSEVITAEQVEALKQMNNPYIEKFEEALDKKNFNEGAVLSESAINGARMNGSLGQDSHQLYLKTPLYRDIEPVVPDYRKPRTTPYSEPTEQPTAPEPQAEEGPSYMAPIVSPIAEVSGKGAMQKYKRMGKDYEALVYSGKVPRKIKEQFRGRMVELGKDITPETFLRTAEERNWSKVASYGDTDKALGAYEEKKYDTYHRDTDEPSQRASDTSSQSDASSASAKISEDPKTIPPSPRSKEKDAWDPKKGMWAQHSYGKLKQIYNDTIGLIRRFNNSEHAEASTYIKKVLDITSKELDKIPLAAKAKALRAEAVASKVHNPKEVAALKLVEHVRSQYDTINEAIKEHNETRLEGTKAIELLKLPRKDEQELIHRAIAYAENLDKGRESVRMVYQKDADGNVVMDPSDKKPILVPEFSERDNVENQTIDAVASYLDNKIEELNKGIEDPAKQARLVYFNDSASDFDMRSDPMGNITKALNAYHGDDGVWINIGKHGAEDSTNMHMFLPNEKVKEFVGKFDGETKGRKNGAVYDPNYSEGKSRTGREDKALLVFAKDVLGVDTLDTTSEQLHKYLGRLIANQEISNAAVTDSRNPTGKYKVWVLKSNKEDFLDYAYNAYKNKDVSISDPDSATPVVLGAEKLSKEEFKTKFGAAVYRTYQDGKMYFHNDLMDEIIKANGFYKGTSHLKPTTAERVGASKTLVTLKGDIMRMDPALLAYFESKMGIAKGKLGKYDIIAFEDNVKLGKNSLAGKGVSGMDLSAMPAIHSAFESSPDSWRLKYESAPEVEAAPGESVLFSKYSVTDGMNEIWSKIINRKVGDLNKDVDALNGMIGESAPKFRIAVKDFAEKWGVDMAETGDFTTQEMFKKGAGAGLMGSQIDKMVSGITKKLLTGRFLDGDSFKIAPNTHGTENLKYSMLLKPNQIAMSKEAWASIGKPTHVFAVRNPSSSKVAPSKLEVVLAEDIGVTKLGKQTVIPSLWDTFIRKSGDFDGDSYSLWALGNGNNQLPMAYGDHVETLRKTYGDFIPPELEKAGAKTVKNSPISVANLAQAVKNSHDSGKSVGTIFSMLRVMAPVADAKMSMEMTRKQDGSWSYEAFSNGKSVVKSPLLRTQEGFEGELMGVKDETDPKRQLLGPPKYTVKAKELTQADNIRIGRIMQRLGQYALDSGGSDQFSTYVKDELKKLGYEESFIDNSLDASGRVETLVRGLLYDTIPHYPEGVLPLKHDKQFWAFRGINAMEKEFQSFFDTKKSFNTHADLVDDLQNRAWFSTMIQKANKGEIGPYGHTAIALGGKEANGKLEDGLRPFVQIDQISRKVADNDAAGAVKSTMDWNTKEDKLKELAKLIPTSAKDVKPAKARLADIVDRTEQNLESMAEDHAWLTHISRTVKDPVIEYMKAMLEAKMDYRSAWMNKGKMTETQFSQLRSKTLKKLRDAINGYEISGSAKKADATTISVIAASSQLGDLSAVGKEDYSTRVHEAILLNDDVANTYVTEFETALGTITRSRKTPKASFESSSAKLKKKHDEAVEKEMIAMQFSGTATDAQALRDEALKKYDEDIAASKETLDSMPKVQMPMSDEPPIEGLTEFAPTISKKPKIQMP